MSEIICEEKTRLVQEYQRTTALYSAAVNRMTRKMAWSLKAGYFDGLMVASRKARHASIEAREELERHIAQHGC
jgi:hypothetical protein